LAALLAGGSSGQTVPPPAAPADAKPQVLFERSTDPDQKPAKPPTANSVEAAKGASVPAAVTDQIRTAPVFTAYDLEVHLAPAAATLAVEARVTLRNGGPQPIAVLPLQLSSSLHMERVSLAGLSLPLAQAQIPSDADHTGKLEETVVVLPGPLEPGASLTLSVAYSGTVAPTTARLDRLETPAEIATSSDWDRISDDFTGLRGFGDVVWYPACSVPALLGDGAKLFAEIGRQRLRNQDASITIHVTDEFTGPAPSIAVLDGQVVDPGTPLSMPSGSFPGVLRFDLPATRLGFRTPSLFVADRTPSAAGASLRVFSTPAHTADAQGYLTAATLVEPLVSQWLGTRIRQPLAVIDLPVEGAQPSEQGDAVLVSLVAAEPQQIAPLLSQELAHTRFSSPRVWLEEGVPALLGNLYAEQTRGRDAALERLAAARGALALVEPSSPGEGSGQSLIDASDAIYYRSKALDVLWMLRDLAGDKPLSAALRAYDPSADRQPDYFEKLLEQASNADLKWFFDAWVYHDLGLPDLSIANVFYSRTQGGAAQPDQWLVSIEIANDGYCEAEVPVTVHSATTAVTERVRVAGRSKISRRMLIVGEPTSVEVNDGTVPEVQASVHQRLLRSE
jgi:hypothetical protein